jgi:DNA-directed RNA polymerase subunit B
MTDVYMNEKFIGNVDNPQNFIKKIKEERRRSRVSDLVNVFYNERVDEVYIDYSNGRSRRPLIVVEEGKSKLTNFHLAQLENNEISWSELVQQGIIEYLDAAEEENTYIALNEDDLVKEHTHIEISPISILGLTTSLVPYSNFGQSSRLNRGSKTQKQGLGLYASNYLMRMDTDVNLLHYPQEPLVRSFMHDVAKNGTHPAGQNVTIAIMSYKGYNMSDSIIVNKGSIDRGLARSSFFRPYSVEELRYSGGLVDEISVPDKEVKGYKAEEDYKYLEEDGIVYPEASLKEDDVVIGKTSPPRFLGEMEEFSIAASTRRESSSSIRHGERGVVDMVTITENEEGNKLVRVRLRDQRIPEVGDKFASRHGQKGIIGLIIPEEDVPFTASGIKPDLIFSPHSLPSRMTISHLIEVLQGKVASLAGRHIDATSFSAEPQENLRKELLELGFKEDGTEVMYNPLTGEQMQTRIFVGNMYYLKLKHMVANKLHSRASGRIQLLTRQPIEGRARGGGLRLGEMEKDCLVAHGASLLLKERFDSDKSVIHIDEETGDMSIMDKQGRRRSNKTSIGEVNDVEVSYAFKLLLDELTSLGIYPKIKLKSKY